MARARRRAGRMEIAALPPRRRIRCVRGAGRGHQRWSPHAVPAIASQPRMNDRRRVLRPPRAPAPATPRAQTAWPRAALLAPETAAAAGAGRRQWWSGRLPAARRCGRPPAAAGAAWSRHPRHVHIQDDDLELCTLDEPEGLRGLRTALRAPTSARASRLTAVSGGSSSTTMDTCTAGAHAGIAHPVPPILAAAQPHPARRKPPRSTVSRPGTPRGTRWSGRAGRCSRSSAIRLLTAKAGRARRRCVMMIGAQMPIALRPPAVGIR